MSSTINALTSGGGIAIAGDTSGQLQLQTNNGTTAVTIDTSQNVGIGTTPSAWGSGFKAIQFANYGSIAVDNTPTLQISQNCYFNGTSWIYNSTNAASNYYQLPSSSAPHVWRYAASGTAGNAITWSEAMHIASSGNLLINTTSDSINSKVAIVGNNYWSASFQCINGGGALLIGNTSGTSAYNAASFYNLSLIHI